MISVKLKNLAKELIRYGKIETTEARAKALKGLVDHIVSVAQKRTLASRRQVVATLGDKKLANRLVDEIAPAFKDRRSGFTRILKLEKRRGDNAPINQIELVEIVERASGKKAKTKVIAEEGKKNTGVKQGKTIKKKVNKSK